MTLGTFVGEPLNHIYQNTKLILSIAVSNTNYDMDIRGDKDRGRPKAYNRVSDCRYTVHGDYMKYLTLS